MYRVPDVAAESERTKKGATEFSRFRNIMRSMVDAVRRALIYKEEPERCFGDGEAGRQWGDELKGSNRV